jgi:hypothetical protein
MTSDIYFDESLLTQAQAIKIVSEWLDDRIKYSCKEYTRSKKRWLMNELSKQCISETIRLHEDQFALQDRLQIALDIVDSISYQSAPNFTKNWRVFEDKELSLDEQKEIDLASQDVWRRRDPKKSFQEGFESKYYLDSNKNEIEAISAEYFSHSWSQHSILDWMLMDISISAELCAYGEELKKHCLPGKKDLWGLGFHEKYFTANGNLEKMTKINWSERTERFLTKVFVAIIAPIAIIWLADRYKYETTALAIGIAYGVIAFIYLAFKSINLISWAYKKILGRPTNPKLKFFKLWDEMYDVWLRLEGPVLNPSIIKEAMIKSANNGAVWGNSAWAFVDRAIQKDSAVWLIQSGKA